MDIFIRFTANDFKRPETSTNTSLFCVKSIGYSDFASPIPVKSLIISITLKVYNLFALLPVPIAVPPKFICLSLSSTL